MNTRPPRLCGCGFKVPAGDRCACELKRAAERNARAEAKRPSANKRGYDGKWQVERAKYLAIHSTCCFPGCSAASSVVDHKIPHRGDLKLFWSRSNWQPLCSTHHNSAKQRSERNSHAGR